MNKNINKNAPVISCKSISINASPERVWEVLSNINQWATWQTDIVSSKLKGEIMLNSTFTWKSGGVKIISTIHTIEPFKSFGWTGKTFGLLAIHNWNLTDINGNTKVEVSESMQGFFATLFKKQFNKTLEKGMQNWLDLLKVECEKDNTFKQND